MPSPDQGATASPLLLVPYMWIGDFVRCHTVVRLLNARWPERPVDMLASGQCAPLAEYMPGVRKAIIADLPRRKLAPGAHAGLARRLRAEGYGTALVMPRTWKAALAPFLAGIPERVGFFGELRVGLLSEARRGERKLHRMTERCAALALPADTPLPDSLPAPQLVVPSAEVDAWRARAFGSGAPRRAIALCPGAVGPGKRWPEAQYAELAAQLSRTGFDVWVVGGPREREIARTICAGGHARDLTSHDIRNAVRALAAADLAVTNDSGLLHVAAAIGTPTIALFGPTSVARDAPLNPIAAAVEAPWQHPCRVCGKPDCHRFEHRSVDDIALADVLAAIRRASPA